ncbi:hypothetical protein AMTR_s00163p00052340 [Amborella trichopoda]|uniref:Uncharacterized protein n=1 Tax=Amborella trichopoda TaxID=13333 RepID=W1PGC2_AMBTC|nr:hypothetical protein AMTR_s00163p00052340 [Amborella trichopoda]
MLTLIGSEVPVEQVGEVSTSKEPRLLRILVNNIGRVPFNDASGDRTWKEIGLLRLQSLKFSLTIMHFLTEFSDKQPR